MINFFIKHARWVVLANSANGSMQSTAALKPLLDRTAPIAGCHPGLQKRDFLEMYCPPRRELNKTGSLPSMFAQVVPVSFPPAPSSTLYDEALHLTVRMRIYEKHRATIDAAIAAFYNELGAVAAYHAVTRIPQLNQFESAFREDFLYLGILEDPLPDLTRMKTRWTRIEVTAP